MLRLSGYVRATSDDAALSDGFLEGISRLRAYLAAGGHLFVFPEGTRSLSGELGRFHKGAFALARRRHAPLEMLLIRNSNRLLIPGRWLFDTCIPNAITVERLGRLEADEVQAYPTAAALCQAAVRRSASDTSRTWARWCRMEPCARRARTAVSYCLPAVLSGGSQ